MENNFAKVLLVCLVLVAQVFAATSVPPAQSSAVAQPAMEKPVAQQQSDAAPTCTTMVTCAEGYESYFSHYDSQGCAIHSCRPAILPKITVDTQVEPSEVALYSPFLVTGKISYQAQGAYVDSVSSQLKLKVVTSLTGGNYLKAAGKQISLASGDEGIVEKVVSIFTGNRKSGKAVDDDDRSEDYGTDGYDDSESRAQSVTAVAVSIPREKRAQERTEYITLGPEESTTVSAYFTADRPGTQFATVSVYSVAGVCPAGSGAPCYEKDELLASSTAKVQVQNKQDESTPPLPPEENIISAGIIQIRSGWNMISVPVNAKISVSDIAAQCGTSQSAWKLSKSGYVREDTLVPGEGYWLKGTRECSFAVAGTPTEPGAMDLFQGWNLVGAFGKEVAISEFAGSCSVTGGPWHYRNSAAESANPYVYSAKLEPGKSYWIKVTSACQLGKGEQPPPPPSGNQAPVITGVSGPDSLKVGETGTWSVSAYDPEGKQLRYYVSWGDEVVSSGASQYIEAGQTATFTHIYYTAGSYRPTFKAVDIEGASAVSSISVSVPGTPMPSGTQKIIIPESGNYEINVAWYDTSGYSEIAVESPSFKSLGTYEGQNRWYNDVQQLGYLEKGAEVVLSITTNWWGKWYPKALSTNPHYFSISQNGTTFYIEADDGIKFDGGYNDALMYIQRTGSNQPPVINSVTAPSTLRMNEIGTWTINAYDPENGRLTYSVNWGDEPSGALKPETETLIQTATLTHAYSQPGTYTATFTVSDDRGQSVQTSSTTIVTSGALLISPDTIANGKVGTYYSAVFSTTQSASWQVVAGSIPNGLAFSGAGTQAYLAGTPTQAGTYTFTVRASASGGLSSERSYTVYVAPATPSVNRAPVVTSVGGPTNLQTGQMGSWTISAYDPEGGPLTYYMIWGDEAIAPLNKAASVGQSSTMTHTYYSPGTYTVAFRIEDSQGASAAATLTVNVAGSQIDCPIPVILGCPSGFEEYKYKDTAGCDHYGCRRVLYTDSNNSAQ